MAALTSIAALGTDAWLPGFWVGFGVGSLMVLVLLAAAILALCSSAAPIAL